MFDRHVLKQVKVLVRASNVGRRALFGFGSWRCSRLVSIFLYEEFFETFILLGHVVAHADTNRAKFPGHKPRQVCVAFGICSVPTGGVQLNFACSVVHNFCVIACPSSFALSTMKQQLWNRCFLNFELAFTTPREFPPEVLIPNVLDECAVKMHRTALMQTGFHSFTPGVAPINWAERSQHIKLHERTLHIDAWVGNGIQLETNVTNFPIVFPPLTRITPVVYPAFVLVFATRILGFRQGKSMLLQFPKCNLKKKCFLRCAVAPVSYRRSLPLLYFGLFQGIVLNFRRLFWSNYLISKPPRFSYESSYACRE